MSLGDISLAYVANDISSSKSLIGTSKVFAVVGESAKLELFNSLTLMLNASVSLEGNGKKLRHFDDLSAIIVVFEDGQGVHKALIFNEEADTGDSPIKEVQLTSVDPVAVAASLPTN